MRIERADTDRPKGWYLGPWNADLDISIGYANTGVDDPHLHLSMTEIYLMARGMAEVRVEQQTVVLCAGEVLVVEPGEAHTFTASSPDHVHFVVQVPGLAGEAARADKVPVPRARLGLAR
ncbi:MAG: cupin domain-containing protein [Anaerolineae bacterium]|nr:cupin domain-containing protein [Anaerolineae bacterium]